MKYYISNDIKFLQGIGNLRDMPCQATHMTHAAAADFVSKHPDHMIVYCGNNKKAKKNRRYIVSTRQEYIGPDNSFVSDVSKAKSFTSDKEAFDYIDSNPNVVKQLVTPIVIDEKYHRYARKPVSIPEANNQECLPNIKRIQFSPSIRHAVFEKSKVCAICGKPIDELDFTIDHRIPLSRGGTNDLSNLQPTHESCNHMKHNLTQDELISSVCDIGCFNIYNSPDSDISNRMIRSFVRGTLLKYTSKMT